MEILGRALARLLDVLAPPGCAACDAPCASTFCAGCGDVRTIDIGELDGVPLVVAGEYAAPLSTAITRFKYQGRPDLARSLASLLVPGAQRFGSSLGATLVPVPLHPRRLATRGYNQAALLAQELSALAGSPCAPLLLRRARETERQVGKSRTLRLTNASGAFALRRPGPKRVVLVDDVVTTGATVRACAQALTDGGVELAGVVALARALPGQATSRISV